MNHHAWLKITFLANFLFEKQFTYNSLRIFDIDYLPPNTFPSLLSLSPSFLSLLCMLSQQTLAPKLLAENFGGTQK
jgi:hypothetical protein